MRIVTITWARNMADCIEAFVRHHAAFASRMIVVDHGSLDATPQILEALAQEGLPVELRRSNDVAHRQSATLTGLLAELRLYDEADWVLPLDADEFVTATGASVPEALQALATDAVTLLPWHNYIPTPQDDPNEPNVLRRIRHRRATETPQWFKVAIARPFLQRSIILPLGSHTLLDAQTGADLPYRSASGLALAHFPVRLASQVASKVFGGWPSALADAARMPGTSFQWKALYDHFASGAMPDAQALQQIALNYASAAQWEHLPERWKEGKPLSSFLMPEARGPGHTDTAPALVEDPVPCSFSLRYPADPLPPITILAEGAERLALEVAALQQELDSVRSSSQQSAHPLH